MAKCLTAKTVARVKPEHDKQRVIGLCRWY
jgi:hypothetical protein